MFEVYRDAGLLRPSDPKLQLYWVARRCETVELTARGRKQLAEEKENWLRLSGAVARIVGT